MKSNILKSLFFLLCLSLMFGINAETSYSQENKSEVRKIAEYEDRSWDDMQSVIDTASAEVYKDADSRLVIIAYGARGRVRQQILLITDYIISFGRITSYKIKGIEGGEIEKPVVEFWLVPKGADEPTPKSIADKSPIKKVTYISRICYVCEDGEPGRWAFEVFAEELMNNPDAKGYLVYYKDKTFPDSKVLNKAKTKLIKDYKINPSRIRAIGGGIGFGRIEFYVVPKGQSFRLPQKQKSVKKNR